MVKASATIDIDSLRVAGGNASKYITEISSSGGIQVHDASNNSNYVAITSSGMEIYSGTTTAIKVASFGAAGAQIGQNGAAHSVIDANGQRFYASNGTTQLANIGYGPGTAESGTATMPYYTFGVRQTTASAYLSTSTYAVGEMCIYDEKLYVCIYDINTPESWTASHWRYHIGNYSHAEGLYTIASGYTSHAEGSYTIANGMASHAEGRYATANGTYSHAEGYRATANKDYSHAEGYYTTANEGYSHAEGRYTLASGTASHAEGYGNGNTYNIEASDRGAHAEGCTMSGYTITSTGRGSHAEGYAFDGNITASGYGAHAEGNGTTASGYYSHAEGVSTTASVYCSHTQNLGTTANMIAQTAIGTHNALDSTPSSAIHGLGTSYGNYAFIIGNGTGSSARSNALTVDWNGNIMAQGMAGQIIMYAGSTAPTGWLICDGSAVSRTTYEKLYAVIGTTYGTGNGSTTFNLPDLRGRFPLGIGTGTATGATAHTLNQKGGNEDLIVPYHKHIATTYTASKLATGTGAPRHYVSDGEGKSKNYTSYAGTSGNTTGANMPPYIGINFIIATGKTS